MSLVTPNSFVPALNDFSHAPACHNGAYVTDRRYQITLMLLDPVSVHEVWQLVEGIVDEGHLPVVMTLPGTAEDALNRHLDRTDFLLLLMRGDDLGDPPAIWESLVYGSLERSIPLLAIPVGAPSVPARGESAFVDALRDHAMGFLETPEQIDDVTLRRLTRLVDAYERPGWVRGTELPADDVVSELARLSRENEGLRRRVAVEDREAEETARRNAVLRALEANRILIPLWPSGAADYDWRNPFDISLYEFFLRIAPELAVERSAEALASFIPTGVCEHDPKSYRERWPVPSNQLNLWLTDLMALGLVGPSKREHRRRDEGQYWTLTKRGRLLLAEVRRAALERGGPRHVGFTSEFPVMGGP